MPKLTLFINTSNNTLVGGQTSSKPVDPLSLPFFYGDPALSLNIYLLEVPAGYNPNDPAHSTLATIPTNGLQLFLYIDDGTANPGTIYTQQIAFASDPTNSFFTGTLSLYTAALTTLIGTGTGASAWIKLGYVIGGNQTTVFSAQIKINVGLPISGVPNVPAGQTALSNEVAVQSYFPLQPKNGLQLYLASPNGKVFAIYVTDNADGTASLQSSPVN